MNSTLHDRVAELAVTWSEGNGGFTAPSGRAGNVIGPTDFDMALDVTARKLAKNHAVPMPTRRTESTVSVQEASTTTRSITTLLDVELQPTVDDAAHVASKAQKAS